MSKCLKQQSCHPHASSKLNKNVAIEVQQPHIPFFASTLYTHKILPIHYLLFQNHFFGCVWRSPSQKNDIGQCYVLRLKRNCTLISKEKRGQNMSPYNLKWYYVYHTVNWSPVWQNCSPNNSVNGGAANFSQALKLSV